MQQHTGKSRRKEITKPSARKEHEFGGDDTEVQGELPSNRRKLGRGKTRSEVIHKLSFLGVGREETWWFFVGANRTHARTSSDVRFIYLRVRTKKNTMMLAGGGKAGSFHLRKKKTGKRINMAVDNTRNFKNEGSLEALMCLNEQIRVKF